jgi:hypothetical protein
MTASLSALPLPVTWRLIVRFVDFLQPGAKAEEDQPPPSNRPGLNSTVPLAMAPSALRTAQPVVWPRSSARIAVPVGSPAASANAGTEIALASVRTARRVATAMIVPS